MLIEEWKPVVGCEGSYEVSSFGRVRSVERLIQRPYRGSYRRQPVPAKVLSPCLATKYPTVTLDGRKTCDVHSLVLAAFVGPRPPGHEGLHADGNRRNNELRNLRWGTSKDNSEDSIRHGTMPRGEQHGASKLSDEKVRAIRSSGRTLEYFAKLFDVSLTAVSDAKRRRTWKHLA